MENHASPGAIARKGRRTIATVATAMPTTAAGGPPARASKGDDREQRQQEERIELRGDREAEHERRESGPSREERGDRAGGQGDG